MVAALDKKPDNPYLSMKELYSKITGIPVDKVDLDEVKLRLRSRFIKTKEILREMGYGWMKHPSESSEIRATAPGEDSAINCIPYYHKRTIRAAENELAWTERTVGNPKNIMRNKTNAQALAAIHNQTPRLRDLLAVAGYHEEHAQGRKRAA